MDRFVQILKRDTINLFINPVWLILGLGFPFLFAAILGLLTEGLYGSTITSYDYYGVTMLLFSAFYAGTYAANSFLEERIKLPNLRIIFSPVKGWFIPISKILATFFFTSSLTTIAGCLLFLCFKVNFGGKLFIYVWLLFLMLDFLFSCLGVFMCCIFKSEGTANQILSLVTVFLGLLSGYFFPVISLGERIAKISHFSPTTMVLETIFSLIYDQDTSAFLSTFVLLFAFSLGLLVLIHFLFKGEEYL